MPGELYVRQRGDMLFDAGHPKVRLALLMLGEAYTRGASRVELHRRESCFVVVYWSAESAEERDVIPNRHWHDLVAALHMLAAETAFRYAMKGAEFAAEADAALDRIEIDREVPGFDNQQLRELQARLDGRLVIDLSFTDSRVQLVFKRGGAAEPSAAHGASRHLRDRY